MSSAAARAHAAPMNTKAEPIIVNRHQRRADAVANRAVHGKRWNKGGDGWRVNAERLGQQRAGVKRLGR